MNPNEIILRPPAEVTVNQWKGGELHFRCGPNSYGALAELFFQLATQCEVYDQVSRSHQAAMAQVAPLAPAAQIRIEEMEREIARLRGAGIPVSVNTKPQLSPAQQLVAITAAPSQSVASPAPTVMEVAEALSMRGVQHPVAAAAAVAVHNPPIPPANVPPQIPPPMHIPSVSIAHQNFGPSAPGIPALAEPPIRHVPILRWNAEHAGKATPDAPGTIISGGAEPDDGELGPPPASI